MSSYEVAGHVVDHPPLFLCRQHKSPLKLNRAFVEELLAFAPDVPPQPLTELTGACLDGDEDAFRVSDYLLPPKVTLFNRRRIEGPGALPFVVVLVDRRFFGIPGSYLRRRIFEGCDDCAAENDPASDASFSDYKRPAKVAPAAAPGAKPSAAPAAVAPPKAKTGALRPPQSGPPGVPRRDTPPPRPPLPKPQGPKGE